MVLGMYVTPFAARSRYAAIVSGQSQLAAGTAARKRYSRTVPSLRRQPDADVGPQDRPAERRRPRGLKAVEAHRNWIIGIGPECRACPGRRTLIQKAECTMTKQRPTEASVRCAGLLS